MTALTQTARAEDFLLSEAPGNLSREALTIASGAGSLVAGSVLGRITKRQAAAPIPTIVGTGTGVMTLLTFGPDVQVGSYVITLTETSATAVFTVVAPDGTSLPNGAVGTAYKSNHLSFLISNGGTMTAADAYTVVVTAGGTPVLVGTGSGTVSGVSLSKYAKRGTYTVRLLATSATAKCEVIDPDGNALPQATVQTAYTSDHVNFTLGNGGTMTAGDYFNIIVAGYTSPEGQLWDPTAVNGANEAYGVLCAAADAASSSVGAAVIVRQAEIDTAELTWKSTVTAAQKTEAYRQLAAVGVISR